MHNRISYEHHIPQPLLHLQLSNQHSICLATTLTVPRLADPNSQDLPSLHSTSTSTLIYEVMQPDLLECPLWRAGTECSFNCLVHKHLRLAFSGTDTLHYRDGRLRLRLLDNFVGEKASYPVRNVTTEGCRLRFVVRPNEWPAILRKLDTKPCVRADNTAPGLDIFDGIDRFESLGRADVCAHDGRASTNALLAVHLRRRRNDGLKYTT